MRSPALPLLASFSLFASLASVARGAEARTPARVATELCAGCHGTNLTGAIAPNLLDSVWKHGSDDESILRSIRDGFPQANMPPFATILSEDEQRAMVAYIKRQSLAFGFGQIPPPVVPDVMAAKSQKHDFRLETIASGLNTPWGIAFLPQGKILVSDRIGELRIIENGKLLPDPVRDTPKPYIRQDGGFLDLTVHPKYAENGWVYLAYTEAAPGATGPRPRNMTIIVRGKIRDGAWVEQQDIFRAPVEFYSTDTSHYGCRFLWDAQGHLFFTIGERGNPLEAQDLKSPSGKIHRVFDDGRTPPDNPFVNRADVWPSIWSYGHRHVQGLQFHPVTGKLWATEHGPRGGDELNRIEPGRNYGWPIISNGLAQGNEKIEGTERAGMESPITFWTPSAAPTAIEFYTGDRFPQWKNNLFISFLFARQLRRLELDGDKVVHQEVLFGDMGRVRDVVQGPDGYLYVALNHPGRIARLVPAAPGEVEQYERTVAAAAAAAAAAASTTSPATPATPASTR